MNEYLCFMPLYLDFTDCTDITADNIDIIDNIGYKRRWKLAAYKRYNGAADLNSFIGEYSDKAPKYIPIVGIVIGTDDISELLEADIAFPENFFFTIDVDSDIITDVKIMDNISSLAFKAKILFRNINPETYHLVIPAIRNILKDKDSVMFESDYLSPASDAGNTYLDINRADIRKISDLCRYAISVTYNDNIENSSDNGISHTNWELFRKNGIFNMIRLLRDYGFSEQEIAECTYHKFYDFFGAGR